MNLEIKNAIIEGVTITNDDHGMLSAWLYLSYHGSGQGFGGYALYQPEFPDSPNYAGHFIWRTLQIADVTEWGKLIGKTIRVQCEHSKVHAIGHIIKDDWFFPSEDFAKLTMVKPKEEEPK